MNGHGGRRSKSGRKLLLSAVDQLNAASLCEYFQQRSSKRATARRLNSMVSTRFPGIFENYREIRDVPGDQRYMLRVDDDRIITGTVELAQEALLTNAEMLRGQRLSTTPRVRGFKRAQINKWVARIMSRRCGKTIKPDYIDKVWKKWRPTVSGKSQGD